MFLAGHNIKFALLKHDLKQVWLIEQLKNRGITTDKTELSSVLSGARTGPKAELIINTSNEIISSYDKKHNKSKG